MPTKLPTMLTLAEVAAAARVCPKTAERWCLRGKLRSTKVGSRRLVLESELRRFLGLEPDATGVAS